MLARNALMLTVAATLTAAFAGAQQPAKPAAAPRPAATALPVNADSAKKVVAANASGATVSSARLRRNAGKAYYAVSYRLKGGKKTMHATVDANTGAFAPVASSVSTKPAAKKPS